MQFYYGHLTLNASQFVIERVMDVWQPGGGVNSSQRIDMGKVVAEYSR